MSLGWLDPGGYSNGYEDALEQQSKQQSNWRSVRKWPLVHWKNKTEYTILRSYPIIIAIPLSRGWEIVTAQVGTDGDFVDNQGNEIGRNIEDATHWMELPSPPSLP